MDLRSSEGGVGAAGNASSGCAVKFRMLRSILTAAILLVLVGYGSGPLFSREVPVRVPAVRTPAPGSSERRVILDAVRVAVNELHGLEVIFVVRELTVSDGWAWVHTLPRSKRGDSIYEDVYALLHRVQGRWRVVEIPCTEPDNPGCLESPGYFRNLAARFPGLPSRILPRERAD